MADQPVRGREPAAGAEDAEGLGCQGRLVGDVDDRVLAEDQIDARVGQRQRPRCDLPDFDPVGEASGLGTRSGLGADGHLNVDADDLPPLRSRGRGRQ